MGIVSDMAQRVIRRDVIILSGTLVYLEYVLIEGKLDDRYSYTLVCRADNDEVHLNDITSEKGCAEEIYRKFLYGEVTPISAYDVIEELLSEF